MTSSGARAAAATVFALSLLVAGCSSTTDGNGGAVTSGGPSSSPDFPSSSPDDPSSEAPAPSQSATASGPSTHAVPETPRKTVTVHAASGTNYLVKIWVDVQDKSCFDHAYGQAMTDFLVKHPCRGLERYLGTTTVDGNPVGFAESVTSFAGTASDPYVYSREFTRLENADGTGSISDLLREGYRLPAGPASVPASEAFHVLGQDNGVTVWDAWYLADTTPANDPKLIEMMEDIFLQF